MSAMPFLSRDQLMGQKNFGCCSSRISYWDSPERIGHTLPLGKKPILRMSCCKWGGVEHDFPARQRAVNQRHWHVRLQQTGVTRQARTAQNDGGHA